MTVKECLELILSHPVEDPKTRMEDIPCLETSDVGKLCQRPVVSVKMTTYNQEDSIGRAIESILMQETDFEYELVIGEDGSKDRTREICLDYQRRFPDRVRVLWSEANVGEQKNGMRIEMRCRGEYMAFCEGDDYWIDPKKLQKEVEALREMGAVLCVADNECRDPDGHMTVWKHGDKKRYVSLEEMIRSYFHTTTMLVDRKLRMELYRKYPQIVIWHDVIIADCLAAEGAVVYLPEVVSVYNWTGNGIGGRDGGRRRHDLAFVQLTELALDGPTGCSAHYCDLALQSMFHHAFIHDRSIFDAETRDRLEKVMAEIYRHRYGRFSRLGMYARLAGWEVRNRVKAFRSTLVRTVVAVCPGVRSFMKRMRGFK